jgi:hypothetical protein
MHHHEDIDQFWWHVHSFARQADRPRFDRVEGSAQVSVKYVEGEFKPAVVKKNVD